MHGARPVFLERVRDVRIPERLQSAVLALAGSAAVVAGACAIDAYRLHEALHVETLYRQQYDRAALLLERSNVYYDRVRSLAALDRSVHTIAQSGDTDAVMLAEIANRLPAHAWLTAISRDATGFSLNGRARDLTAVSDVLNGLMRAKHIANPVLTSTARDAMHDGRSAMTYEIHVGAARR